MPYIAQRKFKMYGQEYAPPGNAFDLPHVVPSELVERIPTRSLNNMLSRGMIRQVEAVAVVAGEATVVRTTVAAAVSDLDADPRVTDEGHGWWLVQGKRVHGRKGVQRALDELGG